MPKVPEGKLTIKQKKFVKAYVANDGNGQEAAKRVYNVSSDAAAAVISSQNLNKVNVKEAIELALEKHGITMEKAIAPIAKALEATNTKWDYENKEEYEVEDHSTRLKASGMALKLLGAEKNESGGNTFIFNKGDVVAKKYVKD